MNPYIFTYKSFAVTWFVALAVIAIVVSNIAVKYAATKKGMNKSKIDDIFFILLITGFVGARLFYVLFNYNLFKDDLLSIIKLSHMNLYLYGGILVGLGVLYILSKKNNILFYNMFKVYVLPLYFSIAIGIWSLFFDGFLIGKEYNGVFSISYLGTQRHPTVVYISLLFLLGAIIESINFKESFSKKVTYATFIIVILGYYVIRHFYAY